jgi:hypothetical protein
MCYNLHLHLLLFYCLFMLVFSFLFDLFHLFVCFSSFIAFSLFLFGFFIALPFFPLPFHLYFVYVFRLLWVSSLAYPNLLGTKRLGCCKPIVSRKVD